MPHIASTGGDSYSLGFLFSCYSYCVPITFSKKPHSRCQVRRRYQIVSFGDIRLYQLQNERRGGGLPTDRRFIEMETSEHVFTFRTARCLCILCWVEVVCKLVQYAYQSCSPTQHNCIIMWYGNSATKLSPL